MFTFCLFMFWLHTVVLSKTRKLQYTNKSKLVRLHCSSCGDIIDTSLQSFPMFFGTPCTYQLMKVDEEAKICLCMQQSHKNNLLVKFLMSRNYSGLCCHKKPLIWFLAEENIFSTKAGKEFCANSNFRIPLSLKLNVVLWYFKLWILLDQNSYYQRFTPSGCKDIGNILFDFVAKTQFLYNLITLWNKSVSGKKSAKRPNFLTLV